MRVREHSCICVCVYWAYASRVSGRFCLGNPWLVSCMICARTVHFRWLEWVGCVPEMGEAIVCVACVCVCVCIYTTCGYTLLMIHCIYVFILRGRARERKRETCNWVGKILARFRRVTAHEHSVMPWCYRNKRLRRFSFDWFFGVPDRCIKWFIGINCAAVKVWFSCRKALRSVCHSGRCANIRLTHFAGSSAPKMHFFVWCYRMKAAKQMNRTFNYSK